MARRFVRGTASPYKRNSRRCPVIRVSCISILMLTGLARADSIKLSHGSTMSGDVVGVTFRVDKKDKVFARKDIASLRVASGSGIDRLTTADNETLKGRLVKVEFKTIAGVMGFQRSRIKAVVFTARPKDTDDAEPADDGNGPGDKDKPKPKKPSTGLMSLYADKVLLKTGHEVRGVVLWVRLDTGKRTTSYTRKDMSTLEFNDANMDVIWQPSGKKVRGKLVAIGLRLAIGLVELAREELVMVRLAKVSATNPPIAAGKVPSLSDKQRAAQEANRALKDAKFRNVVSEKETCFAAVKRNYLKPLQYATALVKEAAADTNRARDTYNRAKRSYMSSSDDGYYYSRDYYKREMNDAAALYREKLGEYKKAKSLHDKLKEKMQKETRVFQNWSGKQITGLNRRMTRHNFLIVAGAVLTEAQMSDAYDRSVTKSPEVADPPKGPWDYSYYRYRRW